MSYVEHNLIPGEKVFYRTGLHWSLLIGPFALGTGLSVGALLLSIYAFNNRASGAVPSTTALIGVGLLAIAAALIIISGIVRRNATEMAVTNKRVVAKTGILTRRTFELLLSKIESIGVEESLMGRMLGFGTVIIRGTGGTPETFPKIAHPLEFRKEVQTHIEIYQQQSPSNAPLSPALSKPSR